MWPLAVLTGDRINGFFYKEMYGCFAAPKKTGRNNEVIVLSRWPWGGVPLYFKDVYIYIYIY